MDYIYQMEPWIGKEEKEAIAQYMGSGGWITEFQKTGEFEAAIKAFTGAKHCIVVNNGTISLSLAALACGIRPGDEVIVPNYTMIATPNALKLIGANPVFVDVEADTLCLDFHLLESAVSSKTKAIILVTANGRYPNSEIKEFEGFCKNKGLIFIEDAAQSLGSFFPDGRHMGRVGHVGSFSFSTPKIITTGQGGALITDDDDIALKLHRLKDFGRVSGGLDIHDSIGYNFKFTDIQAVIGIEQMKKLKERVIIKKAMLKLYFQKLNYLEEIRFFNQDLHCTTPWFMDVMAEGRDKLMVHLKKNNIGSRVMYPPINEQKAYNIEGNFPVSKSVGEKGLWLPSASQLTEKQISTIVSAIKSFYSD